MNRKTESKQLITAVSPVITINGIDYIPPQFWRIEGSQVVIELPPETKTTIPTRK